jgi:hypothetical protein
MTATERPEEAMAGIARIRTKVNEECANVEFVGLCSCFAPAYGVPERSLLVPERGRSTRFAAVSSGLRPEPEPEPESESVADAMRDRIGVPPFLCVEVQGDRARVQHP